MVDWTLARQVARFAAPRSDELPDLGLDLAALARELEGPVIEHAALGAGDPPPAPPVELLSRAQWAEANLDTLSGMLDPVATRLDDRLGAAGPFAGALRLGAGVTLAAEVGLVTGYMSQRVLGQYELSLLAPSTEPRLLLVAPNLDSAIVDLGVDREGFLRWVTIHELVHALQFGGVPWLREHLGGLMREYLSSVDVRIDRGAAGGLPSMPNPGQLVERFREGGLAALVQSSGQRAVLDRIQATMALVEGHAEHVMDALAPELVPGYEGMRVAMDARRNSRSAPERALQKLLGLDLKLRQYEIGKAFCDAVVAEGGLELLNRAWQSPESLPVLAELESPGAWIARAPAAA
jgi:coenzyme F420 biosynthesis associated uncharacterized protein